MKKGLTIMGIVFACFFLGNLAFADAEYNIEAVTSNHQLDKKKSYFDLRVKPGEEFDIELFINNTSKQDASFTVDANTATTNPALNINYSQKNPELDKSMRFVFSKMAKVDRRKVTIPPTSRKKVVIHLKIPNERFNGMVLGGIHVRRELNAAEKETSGYVNRFSYVKGVKLTQNDGLVEGDLKLLDVVGEEQHNRIKVKSLIQNPTSAAIGPLKWVCTMTNKQTGILVKEQEQDQAVIAPNTQFPYYLDFDPGKLKTGSYHLKIVATLQTGKEWVLERDFDVTLKDVEGSTDIPRTGFHMEAKTASKHTFLFAAMGAAFATFLFFIIIWKRRKKEEEEEENAE
ncbi:MAG: DUF916 and DUF3324 domain-containing protein [Streptococcaceae bacterium]|nr:DUF916 and DUF3324 domain-containing protein [Streptococcaceae bacterium]